MLYKIALAICVICLGIDAYVGYKIWDADRKEDAAIQQTMDQLSKNRFGVSEKQLPEFVRTHPNYPCHVHSRDERGRHYICVEP